MSEIEFSVRDRNYTSVLIRKQFNLGNCFWRNHWKNQRKGWEAVSELLSSGVCHCEYHKSKAAATPTKILLQHCHVCTLPSITAAREPPLCDHKPCIEVSECSLTHKRSQSLGLSPVHWKEWRVRNTFHNIYRHWLCILRDMLQVSTVRGKHVS